MRVMSTHGEICRKVPSVGASHHQSACSVTQLARYHGEVIDSKEMDYVMHYTRGDVSGSSRSGTMVAKDI